MNNLLISARMFALAGLGALSIVAMDAARRTAERAEAAAVWSARRIAEMTGGAAGL